METKKRQRQATKIDAKKPDFHTELPEEANAEYKAEAKKVRTVEELVSFLKIDKWDYFLVGDGSGSNWQHAGGWATACIQKEPAETRWFFGSTTNATNITMELMAYIDPLLWLIGHEKEVKYRVVHIVTDCNHLVWSSARPTSWRANKLLWQLLYSVSRFGIELHWHWIPRNCVSFNKMCDSLAGLSRLTNVALREEIPRLETKFLELKPPRPAAKPKLKRKRKVQNQIRKAKQKQQRREARNEAAAAVDYVPNNRQIVLDRQV